MTAIEDTFGALAAAVKTISTVAFFVGSLTAMALGVYVTPAGSPVMWMGSVPVNPSGSTARVVFTECPGANETGTGARLMV